MFVDALFKKIGKDYFFHCIVAADPNSATPFDYILHKAKEEFLYKPGEYPAGFHSNIVELGKFFREQGALFIPAHLHQSKSPDKHNHFVKEEEYALPPLGLLVALAEGNFEAGMADVLKMTDKLDAELPTMLFEHKEIVAPLKKLIEAARAEKKPDTVHLAEKLMLHAQSEEQVAYPTALLIGRYVKSKLAP